MKPATKYFLYTRKSTDDKSHQVMSLDSQATELRSFAKRESAFICEVLEEKRSAKLPGRPVFNEMLDRIERGEANGLLCWDIDRLYRNPVDEGRTRWLLQRGIIASIRTPTRQFFPEDAGLLMGVEGGRATDYIIRLAKNVKRGIDEKLRRGEWPGGPKPLGYLYDGRLRNIVPDPEKALIVQTLFAEYATGKHSLRTAATRLFELGVKSRTGVVWSNWSVWCFLTNQIYIGLIKWNGELSEGKFKPLISPDLFKQVQQMLKIKSKPRKTRKGHNFPFCGVFRCSCGSMITAQFGRGHGGVYRYCRCTRKVAGCSEPYVQEAAVASQCRAILSPLCLSSEEASEVRAVIEAEAGRDGQTVKTEGLAMEDKLATLQEKLNRLTHGYLDQLIDEDSYRTTKEELFLQKATLKREIERLYKSRSSAWIEPAREVINTLETLGKTETWDSLSEVSRLVRKIGSNPTISAKQVTFSFSETYDFIPSLLAPVRVAPTSTTSSLGDAKSRNQVWCPG